MKKEIMFAFLYGFGGGVVFFIILKILNIF